MLEINPDIFNETMFPFWTFVVFLMGACFGSFLNVCTLRMPQGESVVNVPSHCPQCNNDLAWYDNIPLVSWTVLNGKCRKCKCKIPYRYFLMELVTAVMTTVLFAKIIITHQPLNFIFPYFIVTCFVITTAVIDFEHFIIPNKTTYTVIILGFITSAFVPEIHGMGNWIGGLIYSLIGFVVAGGAFAIFAIVGEKIFKQEALGFGDVKYIAAIGAILGWEGAFYSTLLGSIFGGLFGIYLMIKNRKNEGRTEIPFGPYLAAGTYLWILYGDVILTIMQNNTKY